MLYALESALFFNHGFTQTVLFCCFTWCFLLFFLKDLLKKFNQLLPFLLASSLFSDSIIRTCLYNNLNYFTQFLLDLYFGNQKYLQNFSKMARQNLFEICWHIFPPYGLNYKLSAANDRSSHQSCSIKKGVPRNFTKFTGKHLCQSLFFNKFANFIKKETLGQVFSCEFCEIS